MVGLVIAGGIGNLLDRIFRGFVVDYLDVCWIHYPVFNFADCCVVVGICVIAVYVLILLRGMEVSMRARRSFDMLLGCGVVVLLGVQTFMIVAGVIKMIPLTGVTMPFLSYGGSSLLSCMAMMGMLCGISGRVREETEEDILSVKG